MLTYPKHAHYVFSMFCRSNEMSEAEGGVGATPGSWQKGTAVGYLALSCEVVTALLKP